MIWEWTKFVFGVCCVPFVVLFAFLMTVLQATGETLLAFFKCYMWREFFDFIADIIKIVKRDFNQLRNSK